MGKCKWKYEITAILKVGFLFIVVVICSYQLIVNCMLKGNQNMGQSYQTPAQRKAS